MIDLVNTVEFEEGAHIYRVNGVEKVSVTRVLKENKLYHDENIPEENVRFGQDRGTKVHKAIKLLVEERLDFSKLDRQLVPFIAGVKNWLEHTGFLVLYAEEPGYNHLLDYCGTPDLVGQFPDDSWAVVDAKVGTGKIDGWVGLQLAAYANFYKNPRSYRRIALRLQANGDHRHREFPSSEYLRDWTGFQSARNLTNLRPQLK